MYDIRILVPGTEDAAANFTRFFVIGHQMAKPTGLDKTSVLCAIKDKPGALFALLDPLSRRKLNLTRIESRPSRRKAWEYVFFIDLQGHVDQPGVREALDEVGEHCKELKVLGSYPHGELEE
jgi:chorismate mutase/prephenate dehydratase